MWKHLPAGLPSGGVVLAFFGIEAGRVPFSVTEGLLCSKGHKEPPAQWEGGGVGVGCDGVRFESGSPLTFRT